MPMRTKRLLPIPLSMFAVLLICGSCGLTPQEITLESGDWPQYRADAGRTGYTPSPLADGLSLRWARETVPPDPAWKGVHTRMTFDYACEPVIGGGMLYFGSSGDGTVRALDAETGRERWTFYTGGPVRFAPVLWRDRVFAVSDDGFLYCLNARDGSIAWKKRGGSGDGMTLGNGRMVSSWPMRGGPVIEDGILYAGAGIWPSEGIFIYALNPENGDELWVNSESGGIEYDQPHGGARSKSGISAQGYLAVAGGSLFVPTGRSVPAVLDLKTGALKYFHLQKHRAYGGSRITVTDEYLFTVSGNTRFEWETIGHTNAIFDAADGELLTGQELNAPALAVTPDFVLNADYRDRSIHARDRRSLVERKSSVNAKGETVVTAYLTAPAWSIDTREPEPVSMIAAGGKIVTASVNGKVTVMDTATHAVVWSAEVKGIPYGLAVAHGRLYVSTDTGMLYCYDGSGAKEPAIYARKLDNAPYGDDKAFMLAADEIVRLAGITEGYCLDLECGDGALAYALARRTNLSIVALDANPKKVAEASRKLDAAGLLGTRVTVIEGNPSATNLPPYFANLTVSGRSVEVGPTSVERDEVFRVLRPCGGAMCIGTPGHMEVRTRDPLPGAGEWTHLYSDPANSGNSHDSIVTAPLGMLWYRDPDFDTPSRHGRGVGPLIKDGRMFVQGTNGIRAYDAYNGRVLWEYFIEGLMKAYDQEHLIGAASTHGNWCIEGDRLYVRVSNQMADDTFRNCLVLDAATGNLVRSFRVPPLSDGRVGYWGYLAVKDGTIFGTVVDDAHITKWGYLESDMSNLFSESKALFALEAGTGKLKWMYEAKDSIRHNAIAIGLGRVYLIDRPLYDPDELFSGGARSRGVMNAKAPHGGGRLLSLDADTGKILFSNSDNIYGTLLALSSDERMLLMTYQFTRFRLPSERGGRMAGFRADDLKKTWDVSTGIGPENPYSYSSRPILNGGTVYFEPFAFDIATGAKQDFVMSRTYNCGIITGSNNLMLYRSGTMAYLDLASPEAGTIDFGGIRPGCWINTIAAGGIVLMPDDTARCNCSYLIKATVALRPAGS